MTTTVLVLVRTLHFGSAMMLFALPYFLLVILRPASSTHSPGNYDSFCRKLTHWLGFAFVVEAVSGVVWFWLTTAQINNQSPWSLLAPTVLGATLWQTPFGHLWLARGVMGIALGLALYLVARHRTFLLSRPSWLNGLVMSISGCLLISLGLAGHVATGLHHQILHLLADAPHLLVAAIWPAGLIPMAGFLAHVKTGNHPLHSDREMETLQRFSQSSLIAVVILTVTGSINGWLMIGSWNNLIATTHGQLFLCKMLIVAMMIGMGAFNRFHLIPRIHDVPIISRTLGRTILAESCLALIVLFIVALHT